MSWNHQALPHHTPKLLDSWYLYQSQVRQEKETGPWLPENRSHQWAICLGIDFAWRLQPSIGSRTVGSSFWSIRKTFLSKSLPNWIKELPFLKSLPDEHCKVFKSIVWCHGPQQLFLCGVDHVVLVPEDGTPRCMSMTSRILYRAYGSSTICKIKVKQAILVVPPIWSADRLYINICVHEYILYTVSSTPEWSYSVTHARTRTHTHTHYEKIKGKFQKH